MVKLTPQEQQEAERMFRIRRHIYDSRNIKDTLLYDTQSDFGICGYEDVSLSGLSDQDKFALVVIIKDLSDYGTVRSDYKAFGWKKEYVSRLAKNEAYINARSLFNMDEGTIAGRGYVLDGKIRREMNEMYEEFLWHNASEPLPADKHLYVFRVNIPNVYSGQSIGCFTFGNEDILLIKPSCPCYDISNWPVEDDGYRPKSEIRVKREFVKQWRLQS